MAWWDDVTAIGWPWGIFHLGFAVELAPNSMVGLGHSVVV